MLKAKLIVLCGALLFVMSAAAPAIEEGGPDLKEFEGVLLNQNCYERQPTWIPFAHEHELACAMMPQCFLSGYYLIIDEETMFRLDKRGELMARRILQKTSRQNNFRVVIKGELTDTKLRVQTMEETGP